MPAPQASQIESIATAALKSAGLQGENIPDLAKALASITADTLTMFLSQAMVMPGIPAAAPPPPGSGSTVGQGTFMPPPAGGPIAPMLEGIALASLNANAIQGEKASALAKVIAGALAEGIMMFTAQVQVAPGIAIAGFATSSPGVLM